jgi:hypothetical protein
MTKHLVTNKFGFAKDNHVAEKIRLNVEANNFF